MHCEDIIIGYYNNHHAQDTLQMKIRSSASFTFYGALKERETERKNILIFVFTVFIAFLNW